MTITKQRFVLLAAIAAALSLASGCVSDGALGRRAPYGQETLVRGDCPGLGVNPWGGGL